MLLVLVIVLPRRCSRVTCCSGCLGFFQKGTLAPKAAGTIHTDFEAGFICADVYSYDDYKERKSIALSPVDAPTLMLGIQRALKLL